MSPASAAVSRAGLGEPEESLVLEALRLLSTAEVARPSTAERARAALARWRAMSDAHEHAAQEARERWQMLSAASSQLREHLPDPMADGRLDARPGPLTATGRTSARRKLLGLALGGIGLAGAAGLVSWQRWQEQQPLFARQWTTGPGEILRIKLPDGASGAPGAPVPAGSEVTLSARTVLGAALHRDRREAVLQQGEARFDVVRDPSRPFTVVTRVGRCVVLGTAFTVADRGGAVVVTVEHGRVRFSTPQAAGAPVELGAGQQLVVRDGQGPDPLRRVNPADVGAWRDGWLVFDDVPLGDALPSINAFRRKPLRVAETEIAQLRLTARFRVADEHQLETALPAVLPLRLKTEPDGSIRLERRR